MRLDALKPRMPTTAEWIKGLFVSQIAMAAWLVAHDLGPTLPRLVAAPGAERLTAPVTPGDQTRRYEPSRLPPLRIPPGTRRFPPLDEMPPRLQFPVVENGEVRLTGEIAEGDADRFADWLAGLDEPPELIWLASPGGAVRDALEIGRKIRAAGIATGVAAGDVCFSACPYVMAAGVLRRADADAFVGVHQHYFGENIALPAFLAVQDIQHGQSELVGYLDDMGINLRLMEKALATPPDEIYVLTPQELEKYRLVSAGGPP